MSKTATVEVKDCATFCPTCGSALRIGIDPEYSAVPEKMVVGLQQFARIGDAVDSSGRRVVVYGLAKAKEAKAKEAVDARRKGGK